MKVSVLSVETNIPVRFRANYYNIPILIYFQDSNPYTTPFIQVKSNQKLDERIKASYHVNKEGFITNLTS